MRCLPSFAPHFELSIGMAMPFHSTPTQFVSGHRLLCAQLSGRWVQPFSGAQGMIVMVVMVVAMMMVMSFVNARMEADVLDNLGPASWSCLGKSSTRSL